MSDTVEERTPTPDPAPAGADAPGGLPPIAIPLVALFGMLILVFSASRIFLAVSKTSAAVIALFMALNILVGAALVSVGRWVRQRPASFPLILLGLGLTVAGGAVAWGLGGPEEEAHAGVEVTVVAQNIAFTVEEITVPANEPLLMHFRNEDAGVQHNVHVGEGEEPPSPADPGHFLGEIITGPDEITYEIPALAPGTFAFICDVHPNMVALLVAEEGAEVDDGTGEGAPQPSPGDSPGASPTEEPTGEPPGGDADIVADDLEFTTSDVTVTAQGGQVRLLFDNADEGVPHNVVVTESGVDDPPIFEGEIITGPETIEYTFGSPGPGDYFFFCRVHPDMTGRLTVE